MNTQKKIKTIIITCLVSALTLTTVTRGDHKIGFDLSSLSGSDRVSPPLVADATEVPRFLKVSSITRGMGILASPLAGSFSANGWNSENPSRDSAIAQDEYYEFSVSSNSETISFQFLDCRLRVSSSRAAFAAEWQYSFDGFATEGRPIAVYPRGSIPVGGDGDIMPRVNLSRFKELQHIPPRTVVTFRLYAWGADAPSNSFAIGRSRPPLTEDGDPIGNALEIQLTVAQ